MELQYHNGWPYYPQLPENFRLATESDFRPLADKIKGKMPFLIHGFHSGRYECYRVTPRFRIEAIQQFIQLNRVYILNK